MSETETWGIVLRDRASGAEQWVACEVTRSSDRYVGASSLTCLTSDQITAEKAVISHARWIERMHQSLSFVRVATPAEYAAHMADVRSALVVDEVERLRAETARLADTLGAIGRSVGAESCDRDVILAAIRERGEDAFRRGAEAMREAAAGACVSQAGEMMSPAGALGCDFCAEAIRALPLPAEATPQPAQSHEATATPDDPLTIADAAARARSAAAQRAECDHRWVTTLDGRRVICMRCHETRLRSTVLR